jgi:hypothetical protein
VGRLGRGLGGLVSGLPGRRLRGLCGRPEVWEQIVSYVGVLGLVMLMAVLVSMAGSVL